MSDSVDMAQLERVRWSCGSLRRLRRWYSSRIRARSCMESARRLRVGDECGGGVVGEALGRGRDLEGVVAPGMGAGAGGSRLRSGVDEVEGSRVGCGGVGLFRAWGLSWRGWCCAEELSWRAAGGGEGVEGRR